VNNQVSISEKIKSNYIDYAIEVNTYRALPSVFDGLKVVQRRLLLTGAKIAHSKLVKSASLIGECMANYHPHGDSSLYSALVGLVNDDYPMFTGQGNWGDFETSPAAYRYTSAKLSDFTKEQFLPYLNHSEFVEGELGHTENSYIATKVPYALINGTSGVGLGVATLIPSFTLASILDLVYWMYSPGGKSEPELKLNYPIYDMDNQVLTLGSGVIKYPLIYEQEDDKSFVIKTHIPGTNVKSHLMKVFKSEIDGKKVFIRDESGPQGIRYVVGKIWWINLQDIEQKLKSITKSTTVNMNWSTGVTFPLVRRLSPKQVIEISLDKFVKSMERWKSDEIRKLNLEIKFHKLKGKIAKRLVITKESWNLIQDRYSLTNEEVTYIKGKSINQLSKDPIEESNLLEKIKEVKRVTI
jgi:DNA gyrase subunit A